MAQSIREVMTPDPVAPPAGTPLTEAARQMKHRVDRRPGRAARPRIGTGRHQRGAAQHLMITALRLRVPAARGIEASTPDPMPPDPFPPIDPPLPAPPPEPPIPKPEPLDPPLPPRPEPEPV